MTLKTFAIVLATASGLAGASLVEAQAADAVRIRGTVTAFAGSTLTVKTREGATDAIALAEGWKISGVAKADARDIKQGDFLGIASVSKADGGSGALEVVIFPAALKGAGEGDRPWDLEPQLQVYCNFSVDEQPAFRRTQEPIESSVSPGLQPPRQGERKAGRRACSCLARDRIAGCRVLPWADATRPTRPRDRPTTTTTTHQAGPRKTKI